MSLASQPSINSRGGGGGCSLKENHHRGENSSGALPTKPPPPPTPPKSSPRRGVGSSWLVTFGTLLASCVLLGGRGLLGSGGISVFRWSVWAAGGAGRGKAMLTCHLHRRPGGQPNPSSPGPLVRGFEGREGSWSRIPCLLGRWVCIYIPYLTTFSSGSRIKDGRAGTTAHALLEVGMGLKDGDKSRGKGRRRKWMLVVGHII